MAKIFFISLLESGDELLRAYWFRPQKLQDTHYTSGNIKNYIVYRNYNCHYDNYKKSGAQNIPAHIWQEINTKCREVEDWLKDQKRRFSAIEYNYDQICLDNTDIEVIKKGIVILNPYIQEYIGEKGVDIAVAVKMIP